MEHGSGTHTIFNQTPPLTDYNLFARDMALQEAVQREGASWASPELLRPAPNWARALNSSMPASPIASHRCCITSTRGVSASTPSSFIPPGMHSCGASRHAAITAAPGRRRRAVAGAHAARAAGYLHAGANRERHAVPDDHDLWRHRGHAPRCLAGPRLGARLLTREYDSRDMPFEKKRGGLIGMGMTEKQGGSDVRANTTRAVRSATAPIGSPDTNGFFPRRNATRTWCWRKAAAGCPASSCRGACPMEA